MLTPHAEHERDTSVSPIDPSLAYVPSEFFEHRDWLKLVTSGHLFVDLWKKVAGGETFLEKLWNSKKGWECFFRDLCSDSLSFLALEPHVCYIANPEELRILYCSTSFHPHHSVSADESSFSVRTIDNGVIQSLLSKMQCFHHLHGVYNSVNHIKQNLLLIHQWLENSSSLVTLTDSLRDFEEAFRGDKWGSLHLRDMEKYRHLAEGIDESLYRHSPILLESISSAKDLLEWLRSQPGDLDFQVRFSLFGLFEKSHFFPPFSIARNRNGDGKERNGMSRRALGVRS
jgi:hypothetical protein